MNENEVKERKQPVSRVTRRIFVWLIVTFCLGISTYLAVVPEPNDVAEQAIRGFLGLAGTAAMFYITGSVIDRSEILDKFGKGEG